MAEPPPPNPQDLREARAHPPRARTPGGVWAALIAAAVVGVGAVGLADLPTDLGSFTAAESLLPPDGYAQQVSYSDGSGWVVENSIGTASVLLSLPEAAGNAVLTSLQPEDASTPPDARIWRQLWTSTSGKPQQTVMSSVGDTGIRRLSVTGTQLALVYSPGMLMLPADAHAGSSWASSGSVLTLGFSYSARGTAAAAAGGCLTATVATTFTNTSDPTKTSNYTETTTYCPGRGPTGGTSPLPDGTGFTAAAATPRSDLAGTPIPPPAFAGTDAWGTSDVSFGIDDPAFGRSTLTGDLRETAVTTSSGTTVFAGGSDLLAYTATGATASRAWVAHPGGSITALGAAGDAALVATTNRELVAYSSAGLRQWVVRLPDSARVAPVDDGAGGVLVLTVDGSLLDIAVADGTVRWRAPVPNPGTGVPVTASGTAFVPDYDGAVHAYAVSDGHALWTADTSGVTMLAASGDAVYGVGSGRSVYAVAASDGSVRWTHRFPGIARGIAVVGGTVIAQSDSELMGLDAGGTVAWTTPAAGDGLIPGATGVIALTTDAATLVDASGDELGSWPLAAQTLAASRDWVLRPDGVWLIDEQSGNTLYQATFVGKAAS